MKLKSLKWFYPAVFMISLLLFIAGCGGGGGGGSTQPLTEATIAGTVTFPSSGSAAKVLAAVAATPPVVELRDLTGTVIRTVAATGTGTAADPFKYSFAGVPFSNYLLKVVNNGQVMKAVIGKDDLSTTGATGRDLNAVATAAVLVVEQKLGVPSGTIGEKANSISAAGLAGVSPAKVEADITVAIITYKTAPATVTQSMVDMVNLTNMVTSTVGAGVDTSAVINGTVTPPASITATLLTYVAGSAPTVNTTAAVTQSTAQTAVSAVAPIATYIQTRSAETTTGTTPFISNYVVTWAAVDTTLYSTGTLNNSVGAAITANTGSTLKILTDYQVYDCLTGTACAVGVPYQDNGFTSSYTTLAAGNYTYVLTPAATTTPVRGVKMSYTAAAAIPVITTANMSATNSGSDIAFTWTNPATAANWTAVDQLRIQVRDTAVAGKMVAIKLKPTATSVTLPNALLTAAGLNPASTTLQWQIQTRQYQNSINVARGASLWKAVPVYTPPVVTPPAGTATKIQTLFTNGLYEFNYDYGATNKYYYFYGKIALAANGTNLTEIDTYLDPVSKSWTSTKPAGFPTYNSTNYTLSPTGWVLESNGPTGDTVAFNADGSATITTIATGATAKITMAEVNLAGQAISPNGLDGVPLVSSPAVFPAGALGYTITWDQISDAYYLWSGFGSSLGTDLTQIPAKFAVGFGMQVYLDNNSPTYYYNAQFVGGTSNVVNIYKEVLNSTIPQTLIGTATYSITTVKGQQILEISIPSALRTANSLGGNPIFALAPTGYIMEGAHEFAGATSNNGGYLYNDIAINHIKANVNTALAKQVSAKSVARRVFGR